MSFIKHYYHTIWLYQEQVSPVDSKYYEIIKQKINNEFIALKCEILSIIILKDHIHCVFSYDGELSTPAIYKQVKGAVSYDINSNKLIDKDLYWQKGYDSFTVSPTAIKNVIDSLQNQEEYHKGKDVAEELRVIRKAAGLIR